MPSLQGAPTGLIVLQPHVQRQRQQPPPRRSSSQSLPSRSKQSVTTATALLAALVLPAERCHGDRAPSRASPRRPRCSLPSCFQQSVATAAELQAERHHGDRAARCPRASAQRPRLLPCAVASLAPFFVHYILLGVHYSRDSNSTGLARGAIARSAALDGACSSVSLSRTATPPGEL